MSENRQCFFLAVIQLGKKAGFTSMTEYDFKRIIARRDPRFDGRFFFGVKTTRIYCRVTCPARPKPENIIIFKSPSEAEAYGYRACLRCRPDVAPGSKLLDGTWNTVSRALRLMQTRTEDGTTIESLADSLGVTSRHLRRLFDEHLGASPIEIMITGRLHFAKQMIVETAIPISEIAFAAGFQSIRRFNEAFKSRFKKSPSEFRAKSEPLTSEWQLKLPIHLPYDWTTVIQYLKRHETYGVEKVSDDRYQRFVIFKDSFGSFTVTKSAKSSHLNVLFENIPIQQVQRILARIKMLFDTDHNPTHIPRSATLRSEGVRVPTSFEPFETAVSIILSQLVSTEQAKARLKKLVIRFGRVMDAEKEVFQFPGPEVLVDARLEELGLTKTMAEAIRQLAAAIRNKKIDFLTPVDFTTVTENILALRGIGPWTAQMIAMRCLGHPDAFPASDLIVQRALEQNIISQEDWPSVRSYLTHCLWRDYSEQLSKKRKGKTA